MKKIIFTSLGLMNCLILFSQPIICDNRLDTAQVIAIAKKHKAYWIRDWYAPPGIKFDEQSWTWTLVSSKSKHTNRGQCKYTNGCTLVKTVTLVIDSRTQKVLSRCVKKKLYPNYE